MEVESINSGSDLSRTSSFTLQAGIIWRLAAGKDSSEKALEQRSLYEYRSNTLEGATKVMVKVSGSFETSSHWTSPSLSILICTNVTYLDESHFFLRFRFGIKTSK
jgi:hypothetical protein